MEQPMLGPKKKKKEKTQESDRIKGETKEPNVLPPMRRSLSSSQPGGERKPQPGVCPLSLSQAPGHGALSGLKLHTRELMSRAVQCSRRGLTVRSRAWVWRASLSDPRAVALRSVTAMASCSLRYLGLKGPHVHSFLRRRGERKRPR